jgi:hypothetical protein
MLVVLSITSLQYLSSLKLHKAKVGHETDVNDTATALEVL